MAERIGIAEPQVTSILPKAITPCGKGCAKKHNDAAAAAMGAGRTCVGEDARLPVVAGHDLPVVGEGRRMGAQYQRVGEAEGPRVAAGRVLLRDPELPRAGQQELHAPRVGG